MYQGNPVVLGEEGGGGSHFFLVCVVCLLPGCVMIFHFNSASGLYQTASHQCGCSIVERMSRMLTIFSSASFLTDKIQKLKDTEKINLQGTR